MIKRKFSNRTGYTMLEMMIIVVVIGVLSAMAVPSFLTLMPKLNLKADARNNLNYLRAARARAVAENTQYGIYFNSDQRKLVYFKDTFQPANATYNAGQDTIIETSPAMHNGISYGASTILNNCVVFFPIGSASNSGSINLNDSHSGKSYAVSILASTGRISLQ